MKNKYFVMYWLRTVQVLLTLFLLAFSPTWIIPGLLLVVALDAAGLAIDFSHPEPE